MARGVPTALTIAGFEKVVLERVDFTRKHIRHF